MAQVSHSWKASDPRAARATWPVMATMGTESALAPMIPVTRLVAPGPGRSHANAHPASNAGVPVGGMGGCLLVAHQDMAQVREAPQRVVKRKDCPAGVAENDVHAFAAQAFADDLRTLEFHFNLFPGAEIWQIKKPQSLGTGLCIPAVPP